MTSLSTLSLERLTMKKGTVIIWNGKPHRFIEYYLDHLYYYQGRQQMMALLEERINDLDFRYFAVSVKDAFNKMEHQILTTI